MSRRKRGRRASGIVVGRIRATLLTILSSPIICLLFIAYYLFIALPLSAQTEAPAIQSRAAVLIDAETGTMLLAKNQDVEIQPASLTKLMTMHIAFTEVDAGNASLDEIVPLPPSTWSVNQPPRSSLMFLDEGQIVTIRELLLGLAIPSGNDAAVAVALRFAPNVRTFVDRMNSEARSLGLSKTRFVEPSGVSEYNMTTAAEFAYFCRYYVKQHPAALHDFHTVAEFAYPKQENAGTQKFRTIVQQNHIPLIGTFDGVDGLKTGYIDESGYNVALTAKQHDTRFIAVILGAPASYGGDKIRDEDGKNILEWGFRNYKTIYPVIEDLGEARVWKGKQRYVSLGLGEASAFTALVERGGGLFYKTELDESITAPCSAGKVVGKLVFYDTIGELRTIPIVTTESVEQGNFFVRIFDTLSMFFKGLQEKK